MRLDLLADLNAERAARRPTILVTDTQSGEQRLVRAAEIAVDPLAELLTEHLRSGRSGAVEVDGRDLFLTVQAPPVRLVVIGAVHIAQALGPMAAQLGLDVSVIDPRTAFASAERFPGVNLIAEWPVDAFARTPLDRYTALAALCHDPKIDDPALMAALAAECCYVGALGSRKSHARRIERLCEAGLAPEAIARIHGPIGLPIGAASPSEIALSILAQIVATLRLPREG